MKKNTVRAMRNIPKFIFIVLVILVLVTSGLLVVMSNFNTDVAMLTFFRRVTDVIAYASISYFMLFLHFLFSDNRSMDKQFIVKATFVAFMGSFVKLASTAYFTVSVVVSHPELVLYYGLELLAWLLITVFFFMYWRYRRVMANKVEEQKKVV